MLKTVEGYYEFDDDFDDDDDGIDQNWNYDVVGLGLVWDDEYGNCVVAIENVSMVWRNFDDVVHVHIDDDYDYIDKARIGYRQRLEWDTKQKTIYEFINWNSIHFNENHSQSLIGSFSLIDEQITLWRPQKVYRYFSLWSL